MRLHWLIFLVLSGSHAVLLLDAPYALAPAVAATVYGPLALLHAFGVPVLAPAPSGGWPGLSLLGWALVIALWTAVWWTVASILSGVHKKMHTSG
ncbi:MAG TPA: hypothetical protein VIM12_17790 [Noviherbaspirillum sp.]|uniref:hypothetical protein n=1 Tax=Noviherbaspirillum sp. TaxID=1926288 RepID=UPI002F929497